MPTMDNKMRTRFQLMMLIVAILLIVGCPMSKPQNGILPEKLDPAESCIRNGPADALRENFTSEKFFSGCSVLQLCRAIEKGDCGAVKKFLEDDIDLSQTGKSGVTPVMWAFLFGYYDLVEQLVAAGAPVDQRLTEDIVGQKTTTYYKGDSILFFFARYTPFRSRLFRLLPYSVDPNQKDVFDATILHYYLGMSQLNPVRQNLETYKTEIAEFVSAGVDVNERLPNGDTPLQLALRHNPRQCIALLENGADPHSIDADGRSFIERVRKEERELNAKGREILPNENDYRRKTLYELSHFIEARYPQQVNPTGS